MVDVNLAIHDSILATPVKYKNTAVNDVDYDMRKELLFP